MNDLTHCPEPDRLITLLYDDEGDPAERQALDAHLDACGACADLLVALTHTRGTLGSWVAPSPPLGFAQLDRPKPPRWQQVLPWAGMAAAALLTLAASAGLAGLDVRYDDQGFRLRTGWSSGEPAAGDGGRPEPLARSAAEPASSDPRTAWVARAGQADPPWRADFDLLTTQLRAEFEAHARASDARLEQALSAPMAAQPVEVRTAAIDEDRLMRRIAQQIEQSEVRQQQNLALRVAELGREFQLRRQADLVQFEQGLARIEQQRRDLIRRVALAQQPQ